MKILWKNIENWRSWKMRFFWGGHFEFSKSAILNFFLLHISEKPSPFVWGIIFFCTMDGFSKILEKKGCRTFMHTTVIVTSKIFWPHCLCITLYHHFNLLSFYNIWIIKFNFHMVWGENHDKGQLISICLYVVIIWKKKTTKIFPGFLP